MQMIRCLLLLADDDTVDVSQESLPWTAQPVCCVSLH